MPMNYAVCVSGRGSNLQALLNHLHCGDLQVTFSLVISSSENAEALQIARKENIDSVCIASSGFKTAEDYDRFFVDILAEKQIDYLILAGFMKRIPAAVVARYRDRILNIHPSLLPSFGGKGMYGIHVHRAVLAYGAKITGLTIHFIDEEYDRGKILYQEAVSVLEDDTPETLAARVLVREHESLWRVIQGIDEGRIFVKDGILHGNV